MPIHPNPYLLTDVMKKELKIAIDDAFAAKIGNPNLKVKGGKTTDYEKKEYDDLIYLLLT